MLRIFMVFVIKSNTARKNANQTLNQLNTAIEQLGANPNFPTTDPAMPVLVAQKELLEQAILKAEGKDRNRVAALRVIVKDTKVMLVTLATDINLQSKGDLAKALTSGFPERAPKTPAGVLPAAGNVRGKAIGNGRIVINWGALKGRNAYRVYSTTDLSAQPVWEMCGETSKIRLVIEDLTPGTLYYFRIVGVNNFGEGAFSDVVSVRCV